MIEMLPRRIYFVLWKFSQSSLERLFGFMRLLCGGARNLTARSAGNFMKINNASREMLGSVKIQGDDGNYYPMNVKGGSYSERVSKSGYKGVMWETQVVNRFLEGQKGEGKYIHYLPPPPFSITNPCFIFHYIYLFIDRKDKHLEGKQNRRFIGQTGETNKEEWKKLFEELEVERKKEKSGYISDYGLESYHNIVGFCLKKLKKLVNQMKNGKQGNELELKVKKDIETMHE